VDKDKKYVGVARELLVEQADKVASRVTIVQSQRTAESDDAGPLSGFEGDLDRHGTFERGNTLLTMALFRQGDRFVRGQRRPSNWRSGDVRLLGQDDWLSEGKTNEEDKDRSRKWMSMHIEIGGSIPRHPPSASTKKMRQAGVRACLIIRR
jgi:hypothetical protein